MTFEELQQLANCYRDRSIDEFLGACRILASDGTLTVSAVGRERERPVLLNGSETIVDHYVARLRSTSDVDAVLAAIAGDRRVRARECIAIAHRLAPSARRPRSRNRALQVIRQLGNERRAGKVPERMEKTRAQAG